MGLLFAGKFKSVIDQTFALKDAREAHGRLERGENFGKIILVP